MSRFVFFLQLVHFRRTLDYKGHLEGKGGLDVVRIDDQSHVFVVSVVDVIL